MGEQGVLQGSAAHAHRVLEQNLVHMVQEEMMSVSWKGSRPSN